MASKQSEYTVGKALIIPVFATTLLLFLYSVNNFYIDRKFQLARENPDNTVILPGVRDAPLPIIKLYPRYSDLMYALGDAHLKLKNYNYSTMAYIDVLRSDPFNRPVIYNLGQSFMFRGDYKKAEICFLEMLDVNETTIAAHDALYTLYWKYLKQPEKALFYLKTSLRLKTESIK